MNLTATERNAIEAKPFAAERKHSRRGVSVRACDLRILMYESQAAIDMRDELNGRDRLDVIRRIASRL